MATSTTAAPLRSLRLHPSQRSLLRDRLCRPCFLPHGCHPSILLFSLLPPSFPSSTSPSSSLKLRHVFASLNMDDAAQDRSIQLYGQIERVFTDVARRSQGTFGETGDWEEIEGAWVIRPKLGVPTAVIHFIGGVFVGAAPQLTYKLFLERLSERGFLIIATPFASGFDHLRIADEVQFKFDRCIRVIRGENDENIPIFGLGHSMGALIQLLIGARYAVQRTGNILISFNNKEASKAIPLFSPVIVPMAQNLGPLINQLMASPTVKYGAEMAIKNLQNVSPFMKQVLPLVEQLSPLYMDLANGKDSFIPHPEETRKLIKSYYGVRKNLLIKFQNDEIDETSLLAQTLSFDSSVSSFLDMSIRTLPGDHARPLQQVLPVVPTPMADAVSRGSEILANLAAGTPWETVARDVGQSIGADLTTPGIRQQIIEDVERLAEEVAVWMKACIIPDK